MSLHNDIMNIRSHEGMYADREQNIAYKSGHRDARHAAAEMCIRVEYERDQLAEALRQAVTSMQDSGYPNSSVVVRQARAALQAMEDK